MKKLPLDCYYSKVNTTALANRLPPQSAPWIIFPTIECLKLEHVVWVT